MKILPIVNNICSDIVVSGNNVKTAIKEGISVANRTAQAHNHSCFKKYINMAKCVGQNVAKTTTRAELPYIAGAIGMFIPLPLTSPLFLGLGFLVRFTLPKSNTKKLRKTLNKVV